MQKPKTRRSWSAGLSVCFRSAGQSQQALAKNPILRLVREQDGIHHVDHAVGLVDVRDGDSGQAALLVG